MFRTKTLFVLGAGASFEVDMPLGSELLKQIVKLIEIKLHFHKQKSGDYVILQALKLHLNEGSEVKKINEHLGAAWQLAASARQALSIDNLIDALEDPKIELVGKLGIARAILLSESKSKFFRLRQHSDQFDLAPFNDTWFGSFTKLLTENVRKTSVSEIFNNVEIVNFNYDRCLEHYLPYSLANYYGLSLQEAQKLMGSLTVHRPYGSVGRLPWQTNAGPSVTFGNENAQELAAVSQQIITFTERKEEKDVLQRIKAAVSGAQRIVFLGFAFHRQNVELLASEILDSATVLATSIGISKSDTDVIATELAKAFSIANDGRRRIDLTGSDCNGLFRDYWRTLTG
jgi:hypothetical protein